MQSCDHGILQVLPVHVPPPLAHIVAISVLGALGEIVGVGDGVGVGADEDIWQVEPVHVPPDLAHIVAGSEEPDGAAVMHELPFQYWPEAQGIGDVPLGWDVGYEG